MMKEVHSLWPNGYILLHFGLSAPCVPLRYRRLNRRILFGPATRAGLYRLLPGSQLLWWSARCWMSRNQFGSHQGHQLAASHLLLQGASPTTCRLSAGFGTQHLHLCAWLLRPGQLSLRCWHHDLRTHHHDDGMQLIGAMCEASGAREATWHLIVTLETPNSSNFHAFSVVQPLKWQFWVRQAYMGPAYPSGCLCLNYLVISHTHTQSHTHTHSISFDNVLLTLPQICENLSHMT